jgi:hypothetical protein
VEFNISTVLLADFALYDGANCSNPSEKYFGRPALGRPEKLAVRQSWRHCDVLVPPRLTPSWSSSSGHGSRLPSLRFFLKGAGHACPNTVSRHRPARHSVHHPPADRRDARQRLTALRSKDPTLKDSSIITPRTMIRAADYRALANDASARARVSVLQRVREQHEVAASTWRELADSEDRRTLSLSRRYGRAALPPDAAPAAHGGSPTRRPVRASELR